MRVADKQISAVSAKQHRLRALCDLGRKRPSLYVKPKIADFKHCRELIRKPNGKKHSHNVYELTYKWCEKMFKVLIEEMYAKIVEVKEVTNMWKCNRQSVELKRGNDYR